LKFQHTLCDALLFKGLSMAVIQVSTRCGGQEN
jgi:hypothetical protein